MAYPQSVRILAGPGASGLGKRRPLRRSGLALSLLLGLGGCGGAEPARRTPDLSAALDTPTALDQSGPGAEEQEPRGEQDDVQPLAFPSCAEARDAHPDNIAIGSSAALPPDIPEGQYSAVLGRGTYLAACGVPATAAVKVCAAVVNGKAVGITVDMSPHRQRLVNCVIEAIEALPFPSHPRLDVATSSFAPAE